MHKWHTLIYENLNVDYTDMPDSTISLIAFLTFLLFPKVSKLAGEKGGFLPNHWNLMGLPFTRGFLPNAIELCLIIWFVSLESSFWLCLWQILLSRQILDLFMADTREGSIMTTKGMFNILVLPWCINWTFPLQSFKLVILFPCSHAANINQAGTCLEIKVSYHHSHFFAAYHLYFPTFSPWSFSPLFHLGLFLHRATPILTA